MIYDSKITETVKINTTETVTFTPKANITAKDTGIEVSASGYDTLYLYLNNNITVTNSANSGTVKVNGVYSDVYTLYLYNETAKKTIKATGKITSGDLDVYGIHLENPYLYMTGEELLYNFNTSAVVDTDGDIKAIGFSASELSSYVAFKGNYTVSAKIGQGMALSYGISLGEAFIRNVSGKFNVSAEAKAGVASAIGVSLNLQKLYSSNIASRLTGSFTVSAKGVMVSAVAVYAASDLSLISVSGAMNVTAKGIQVASAAAIVSGSDIYLYGINSSKITVNSSGVTGSVTYPSKVAAILSEKEDGKIVIGSYTGAISVTASIDDEESDVYGIFADGNITFYGDYTGKLNVVSKDDASDVAGIYSDGFVTMQDITGAWNISANEGYAYGIYGYDGISLGNVSGNKTITSKDDYAYGFYTGSNFQAESISGKISVSAEEYAHGIYSYGDAALGDLSGMTLQVTSKESSAYGIRTYELDDIYSDLIIGSTGLDLGKINVTAYDVAEGVYIYGDITAATVTDRTILSGTVTVKGYDAYGIDADSFDCKIGANVTVNGKSDAIGIYVYNGDVIFEGAKITAKVSTKENCAYAVYHDGSSNDNTIALRGKSQLTGSIYAVAGDDTVVIESGSKLTGGLEDVENLVFDINDASTKKKVMWNATGDWGESALDYNIDFGLLGDFALAQKTKNMQWSDLISNFNDTLNTKYDNALYDYTVYEKGNTLYLKSEISPDWNASVVENKSTATKEISAEYTLFTSKADINVKNGWGIGSEQETETHLVLDNNITVSGSAEMLAGIYSSSEYDLTIYSNNAAKKLKVSNNADETTVAGYIHTGNLSFGSSKFLQDITVSSNGSNGFAVGFYSFVGDAKTPFAGAVEFAGTYAGKLTVSSKGIAFGIWSVDVKMKDITGVWNISGETGAGVMALGDMSFGNISGNKTITAKSGDAFLLATGFGEVASPTGNISLNSISGNVKVSAYGDAYMICATGNLSVKDLSKLNLQVTSKTDAAWGISLEQQNLVMQSTGLNVGKINVKALDTAEGFYIRKITADKITDQTILTGKINIQGEEAYGFRVSDGFDCKIGVDMTVNGKNEAYGIYTQRGNVILEGAKITAKVSDKTGRVYSVYHIGNTNDNSIALRKKSQLTGNIRAEGAKDTVIIESGSKLTGGLEDVENLILELNDQAAAKKSLWDITADLSDNTNLEIDFELGMTGDFVLANNKSGAEWNGIFEDKILLDFDGETQYLFFSDVTTYGYDSLTYNDYDFTLKTKGSQLILSVTID